MQMHKAKRVRDRDRGAAGKPADRCAGQGGRDGLHRSARVGGSGRSGQWSREGQVGRSGMVAVICLIRPERLDTLLDAAFGVVERHIGVVSVTDCEVLRAERF